MKTILTNFLSVTRRFRLATFLNIVGLSVAFAAFMVILMQVWSEYTFDSCHPDADRIYRAETVSPAGTKYIYTGGESEQIIVSSPYIEAATYINPYVGEFYFTVGEGDQIKGYTERIYSCFTDITDVFHFRMKEGDKKCLATPKQVLIPASMAKKIFGD